MNSDNNMPGRGKTGKVYLVGAGPSDVELITVRGKRLLEEAQVIVYDRLSGTGLLMWGNEHAHYIDVGKKAGRHPVCQEEICRILVREAKKGYTVVRLKGGDPLVFGRGAEEAAALEKEGIPYEIVPGVTSAVSVPAYLGIPVTCRDLASSIHIVTAHKKDGSLPDLHYRSLAEGGGTLVFLMGVGTMSQVMEGLMGEGISPDMPAAVLEKGTTSVQRRVTGTVGTIAGKAAEAHIQSPAIIVVGRTADYKGMDWYSARPLAGIKILVTRPRRRTFRLCTMLRDEGAEVLELPTIRIRPSACQEEFDRALKDIRSFSWLVFTSPSGVEVFRNELKKRKADLRCLSHLRIAVIGEGTARMLEDWGLYPDLMPDQYDGAHLGEALAAVIRPGERIWIPRARAGGRELTEELEKAGARVLDLPIYDTEYETFPWVDYAKEASAANCYAMFTSASTVRGFVRSAGQMDYSQVKALCIGHMTQREAAAAGMQTFTAARPTLEALVELAREEAGRERSDGTEQK